MSVLTARAPVARSLDTAALSVFHLKALVVPLVLSGAGLRAVTGLAMVCFLAGVAATYLVAEPAGRALDDISDQFALGPAGPRARRDPTTSSPVR